MRKQALIYSWALLLASFLWIAQPLRADVTGTILGTVTDPSGAAVPNAAVTLRNPDTGLNRKVSTDASGSYEFLVVPVGENYTLDVEAAGFRKSTQSGIKLLVNQKYRADFQLLVGAVTQTVNVSAEAAQVETTSTQLGDVIEDKKMTNLPLNGRSYLDLLGLQAGVVPITSGAQFTDRPISGTLGAGNMSVNGQRESANAFLINGGDVEEGRNNGAAVVPNLDSIQEFRLLTNSFDAEYGRFSGAVVNVLTKGGTNELHGSGFEFLRNEKLDSRNFFDQNLTDPKTGRELPGTARGVFKRNQFGGTIGGPIRKDRVFFFGDYQGTRERQGISTGIIPVPSAQERTGDFSDVGTTGFSPLTGVVTVSSSPNPNVPSHTIADTLTSELGYTVAPNEPYWFQGCASTAQCVFPGQMIPPRAFSPAAAGTLQFVPLPTGVQAGQPFFSTSAFKQKVRDDKFGIRFDFTQVPHTGNWAFYYHLDDSTVDAPFPSVVGNGADVPGFPSITLSRAQQANLGNTRNFGSNAVNELRLNFTRAATLLGKPTSGLGKVSDFGFKEGANTLGIVPADPAFEGVPDVGIDNLGITFGLPFLFTNEPNNTYQISDSYSRVRGRHTVKFGGEGRYFQINERNDASPNAAFDFNGIETGNDFADYLIGTPNLTQQLSKQFLDSRTKYFGLFAQDTYKARPNFTLNYGLRWEASEPFYDTQGKIQGFVPGLQSRVFPDSPTGWVFPGDPGIPKTIAPTRWNNFGPRVGIAYSPGFTDGFLGKLFGGPGKTSIRAASGIYYTAIEDLTLFFEVGDVPFGQLYQQFTTYFDEPYKDRFSNNDPGQRFPFPYPPPHNISFFNFSPVSQSPGFKTDNVLPYAEHFNFTVEREISHSTILSIAYVGTRGHHLVAQYDFTPGNPQRCLLIASLGGGCGPGGEDTIYFNVNGKNYYGTRPYSVTSGRYLSQGRLDFGASNSWTATSANSNYNSLQITLNKRAGPLTFLGAYTWSKSIDNSSGYADDATNPYNPNASRSLSAFDMMHNFVFSYTYNLPFDHLTSSGDGAVHKFLTGWQVSGVTRVTTGLPILMSEGDDQSLCGCSGVDRPNYNGSPIIFLKPRSAPNHAYFQEVFDANGNPLAPFFTENLGVPGNANRRFFHGPGLSNWDLAFHKLTQIDERRSLEFRFEFFNLFNHAQFSSPSGDVLSSTFGQVTGANSPRIGQVALKLYF